MFGLPAGMPKSKFPGQFGDLILTFDVKYPKSIPAENKGTLAQLIPLQ